MNCYIFDVEGTLSDHSHRLHLVPKKPNGQTTQADWEPFQKEFINDPPNVTVVNLCSVLHFQAPIIISTGLHEAFRGDLVRWLDRHRLKTSQILMRETDHGDINSPRLKQLHYIEMVRRGYTPTAIFDDRLDVCEAMKKLGVEAFHLPFQGFVSPEIDNNSLWDQWLANRESGNFTCPSCQNGFVLTEFLNGRTLFACNNDECKSSYSLTL